MALGGENTGLGVREAQGFAQVIFEDMKASLTKDDPVINQTSDLAGYENRLEQTLRELGAPNVKNAVKDTIMEVAAWMQSAATGNMTAADEANIMGRIQATFTRGPGTVASDAEIAKSESAVLGSLEKLSTWFRSNPEDLAETLKGQPLGPRTDKADQVVVDPGQTATQQVVNPSQTAQIG